MEVHFSPFKKKSNSKNIQVPDLIVLDYSFNFFFFFTIQGCIFILSCLKFPELCFLWREIVFNGSIVIF